MVVHSHKPRAYAWRVAIVATHVLLVNEDSLASILAVVA
jgi:hypothetical protein